MALISAKLRNSAKGQQCTFGVAGICCHDPEKVVFCHAPSEAKGMSNKSPDWWGAAGCTDCHAALDQHCLPIEAERFYWNRGIFRTWAIWISAGLIVLPVDPATAKTRPRKKANIKSRAMPGTKASGIRKTFGGTVERRVQEE